MKIHTLISIPVVGAAILLMAACSSNGLGNKLKGEWRSKDNETILKITDTQFIMNTDEPVPEDYFLKGDTIYTSFQGNLPYSKFVVKEVNEHKLKLLYPDSAMVEFSK